MAASSTALYNLPTFIDGKEERGSGSFEVRFPYTGDVIGSAPRLTKQQVVCQLEYLVTLIVMLLPTLLLAMVMRL